MIKVSTLSKALQNKGLQDRISAFVESAKLPKVLAERCKNTAKNIRSGRMKELVAYTALVSKVIGQLSAQHKAVATYRLCKASVDDTEAHARQAAMVLVRAHLLEPIGDASFSSRCEQWLRDVKPRIDALKLSFAGPALNCHLEALCAHARKMDDKTFAGAVRDAQKPEVNKAAYRKQYAEPYAVQRTPSASTSAAHRTTERSRETVEKQFGKFQDYAKSIAVRYPTLLDSFIDTLQRIKTQAAQSLKAREAKAKAKAPKAKAPKRAKAKAPVAK